MAYAQKKQKVRTDNPRQSRDAPVDDLARVV